MYLFNIADFKGSTNRSAGFMKPSKFTIVFPTPPGLIGGQDSTFITTATNYIQYKIDAVTSPGIDFNLHSVRRFGYGPIEKKPFGLMFNECQLSVMCGGEGEEWTFFRRWTNLILNYHRGYNIATQTNDDPYNIGSATGAGGYSQAVYEVAYKSDYMVDFAIMGFRDDGTEVLRTILREAYPISVTPLRYDWSDGARVLKFNILMTYIDHYQDVRSVQLSLGAKAPPNTTPDS